MGRKATESPTSRRVGPGGESPGKLLTIAVQYGTRRPWAPHPRTLRRWASAAYCGPPAELTIRVAGAGEARRLNRRWRGKDKATNVLSFPAGSALSGETVRLLGDLLVCAPVVASEARVQRKALDAHWAHMIVHGMLHLLGYDHERDADAARMEAREVEILASLGYSDPYDRSEAPRCGSASRTASRVR
jgi:probable rRNA maturation factor